MPHEAQPKSSLAKHWTVLAALLLSASTPLLGDGQISGDGRVTGTSSREPAVKGPAVIAPAGRAAPTRVATRLPEVRGIWVTRWDFRTRDDLRQIFKNCAAMGLNRVYFQVRGRADAFYRSKLEPWGEEIGGRDPGFDPLEVAVYEARRHGIEIHAWTNVLAAWKGKKAPRSPDHVFHRHPEWFMKDRQGKRHLLDSHYTILNPCSAQVRDHIVRVLTDIARRYAIDGIHLDYIRFIAEGEKARQAVPYDNYTLRDFRKLTGGFPVRHPARWDQFRRDAVSRLVKEIHASVRRTRPRCILSAAVIRDFKRGKQQYFQDSPLWRSEGWVDEIVPMNYERTETMFSQHLDASLRQAPSTQLVHGIGAYLFQRPDMIRQQVSRLRRSGAKGYALFGYATFFPSPSHESSAGSAAEQKRRQMRAIVQGIN